MKANAFIDISQIRLICNKNLTTEPAEEGNCVCGSVLGKLNTLAHFPFRSVSTSEFYLTKIKRLHARQTSASPRAIRLPLQQGAKKSAPVFCFLSIRLAAMLSQACIMNAHACSPSHTSPPNEVSLPCARRVSPSNWRGTTGGLRKLPRWLRSSF